MHYKRFSWTPYSTGLRIHCSFQCKVCLVSPQNILWPLLLVPETEGQNQDVAADHGVSVAAQCECCKGTSVKCSAESFNCWPWDIQFTWNRSCTGCRIWGTFCTVRYSHSNFIDNFHRNGPLPLPGATPKPPVFSNFIIIFFNPFVDMGPLLSSSMRRYSLNAALLLLRFT